MTKERASHNSINQYHLSKSNTDFFDMFKPTEPLYRQTKLDNVTKRVEIKRRVDSTKNSKGYTYWTMLNRSVIMGVLATNPFLSA
jgi:hypothetical protein